MATLATLTLDVEDLVYGQAQIERPVEDTLKTAVSASNDVTWQFDTAIWKRGDYAEYLAASGAQGEVVQLAGDYTVGADVTVRRAQIRTTAASAYSIGDVFRKNPTFPRVKIQRFINEIIDSLWPDVWIRTQRSLDVNVGRYYYPLTAGDYEVEAVWQTDIAASAAGTFSYDETGGAAEDLWTTTSAHGLTVGDAVRFTTAGTNATGYAVGTVYWVAAVPSSLTVTISATEGGSAVAGTTDGTGWVMEKINTFQFSPLPPDAWEVVAPVDTSKTSSTGGILRIDSYYADDATLFYQAKTKPSSSSVSDMPAAMAYFVPYGAAWLLMGGTRTIPTRIDPLRAQSERTPANQPMVDARFFRDEFERRKAEYRNQLYAERFPKSYLGRGRKTVRR